MKLRLALGLGAFAVFSWVFAPVTAQAQLDHYKCYQGKDLKQPKFTKLKCSNGQNTITSDQFVANECVDVQKVKFVCNPVSKNGSVINDPTAHLICYQIKGANLVPRPKVEISTQFQVSQFEIKKPKLLCVPGSKTIIP
jgi:hypothetical protein